MHWTEYAAEKAHLLEQYFNDKQVGDDIDFHPLDADELCDVNDPTDFELLDMVPCKQTRIDWQLDFELNKLNELRADEFADCVSNASTCSDIELEKLDASGTNATAVGDHVAKEEKNKQWDVFLKKATAVEIHQVTSTQLRPKVVKPITVNKTQFTTIPEIIDVCDVSGYPETSVSDEELPDAPNTAVSLPSISIPDFSIPDFSGSRLQGPSWADMMDDDDLSALASPIPGAPLQSCLPRDESRGEQHMMGRNQTQSHDIQTRPGENTKTKKGSSVNSMKKSQNTAAKTTVKKASTNGADGHGLEAETKYKLACESGTDTSVGKSSVDIFDGHGTAIKGRRWDEYSDGEDEMQDLMEYWGLSGKTAKTA